MKMANKAGKIHAMLADFHKCAAEQHGQCAESMEKGAGREFHEAMSAIHSAQHEAHAAEADETAKAMSIDTPIVSKVAPQNPALRAVPRYGTQLSKTAD